MVPLRVFLPSAYPPRNFREILGNRVIPALGVRRLDRTRMNKMTTPKVSPARVLFRRDLERTPIPMDWDTRLHFLRVLRDGVDLHGLEAYTTDPVRFVHRADVDWSDPKWVAEDTARATVAEVATQTKAADPPPARVDDARPRIDSIPPLSSKGTRVHPAPSKRTLYDVLQVRHEAEPKAIEVAYRWFALKYEPDMNSDPEVGRRMAELKAAYAVLADPIRRKHYDAELLWEGEGMDTSGSQGKPGSTEESVGVTAPVRPSLARKVGWALALVFLAVGVGFGGLWLRNELREKRLENIVSQAHDWPPQEVTLEPGVKFKVSLRTRCSNDQLNYVLALEPMLEKLPPLPDGFRGASPDPKVFITDAEFNAATEQSVKMALQHRPFILRFLDKDGFERFFFSASGGITQSVNSEGHVSGLQANGKTTCTNETYSQFTNWSMSWESL